MLIKNRSTIPSGMLAPSGLALQPVNPDIQSTTRPGGSLLQPSPGYDSIRRGKNRFQGKGFTGGFRRQEFAEDIDGTGAALVISPGETSSQDATEWLPENLDSIPEGSILISDRKHEPGFAERLHEAYNVLPDMGDRTPERPLTMAQWFRNPVGLWRRDYRENRAMTVAASIGAVFLVKIVAEEIDQALRGYRPRGVGEAVTEPVGAAAGAAGTTANDVSQQAESAVKSIGAAADEAVSKIGDATDSAVRKIESAAS